MMRSFLIAALVVTAALAAPQPHTLQKRSFHAHSHGRGLSAKQEIARTHRKFGWDIIVADSPSPAVITSTVIVPPAGTGGVPAPTGYGSPTWDNSTSSTATSGAASTPTSGSGSEDGEVTATPEADESEYLSPVTVGGQKLTLNFDTGSADL